MSNWLTVENARLKAELSAIASLPVEEQHKQRCKAIRASNRRAARHVVSDCAKIGIDGRAIVAAFR